MSRQRAYASHLVSYRVLKWLVDEKQGMATVKEMGEYLESSKGWATMSVARYLARNGWVEVREPSDCRRFRDSELFVTDAGRLWRDYFDWEEERLKLTRVQLHGRIRALELALKPLVRMHEQYSALGCVTSSVATALECRLANLVLNSPNSESVVYPWSPGFVGEKINGPTPAASDISRPDQNDSPVGIGSDNPD